MTTTDKPVIGLIGAGMISRTHMPALRRLAKEVVIFSVEGAEALAETFGGTVVGSMEELLERVDMVDIVTPTFTHHDVVRTCLEAGKDVIVEKPIALTEEEAAELIGLAASLGRRLYPAHVVRYMAPYVLLKDAVEAGKLGDLAVLRFSRTGAYPTRSAWFADADLSGGVLMDLAIHDIDIARWVAGRVVRVSAVVRRAGSALEPVDAGHVMLTHDSGAITHCAGLWGLAHQPFETEFSVAGTRGTLSHSTRAENGFNVSLPDGHAIGGLMPETDPNEDPYFLELRDLVTAAREGKRPRVTAEDGLEAVRIVRAALESVRTGQPVEVSSTVHELEGSSS